MQYQYRLWLVECTKTVGELNRRVGGGRKFHRFTRQVFILKLIQIKKELLERLNNFEIRRKTPIRAQIDVLIQKTSLIVLINVKFTEKELKVNILPHLMLQRRGQISPNIGYIAQLRTQIVIGTIWCRWRGLGSFETFKYLKQKNSEQCLNITFFSIAYIWEKSLAKFIPSP